MTKNEAAADALKKAESERQAKRRGAARLNKAMRKVLAGMTPPDDLTVTQWAEAKRRLSAESAAEPGPWRTERTPYLREPMDAFTDPKVRHIVMVAASQVGKSEFLNNCIGYIIDEDPGSILFIHPTTIDAQEYSKLRIAPMLRDSPALRQKIAAPKSRDSHNTILQKAYISPPKKQKIFVNQIAVGTCWQYQLGVDSGKEIIMDNLRVQTPGQKYCHFPKRDDYGSAYFAGLLSETKVYDPNKKQPWSWKKIPGHERNEPLDCRNYALAAFKALPKNLDEIDRQIKAASGVRVPAPPSANITPPKRRTAQRGRQKYYDDW